VTRFPAAASAVTAGLAGLAARGPSLMPWPEPVRKAFPYILGGGVGAAVLVTTELARRSVGALRGTRSPSAALIPLAVVGGLTASGWLAFRERKRFLASMFEQTRRLDPGFAAAPLSAMVSGGPESLVSFARAGREGGRFLGSVTTAADVQEVMGTARSKEPIRVFVGYDAAGTVDDRVELALAELRRTNAFDRSVLLVACPAGTGYANPTPVDVLEIVTSGDCATVVVGYGLLPSFLSLDRVDVGVRTQHALLEAIAKECGEDGPRVVLYGESLGARVQQAALPGAVGDLARLGIDRVLWVGTPGGAEPRWGTSITLDNPTQVPANPHTIPVWFLEHDGDPVVRLAANLSWRRPEWLTGPRGRSVPEDMEWRPVVTYAQVLVDTLFAQNVKPGDFQSHGHDYRADLGAVVAAAYDLTIDGEQAVRLEERLRSQEVARAARIDGTVPSGL
jgi:uncharacterized membrane protein